MSVKNSVLLFLYINGMAGSKANDVLSKELNKLHTID